METPIRILHLEDVAKDAELIQETLHDDGLAFKASTVKTRAAFEAALQQGEIDLILADYNLPGFDGLSALALAKASHPAVPFIFVSGSIGEELAIEISKNGATDYVLKDRLARLGTVVRRARREALEKAERQKAEAALHASQEQIALVLQSVSIALYRADAKNPATLWISENIEQLCGFPTHRFMDGSGFWVSRIHAEDRNRILKEREALQSGNASNANIEYRWQCADGYYHWFLDRMTVIRNPDGTPREILGSWQDITENKKAEEALRASEAQLKEAQRLAHVGNWIWNVETDTVIWSEELYNIAGRNSSLPAPNYQEQRRIYTPASFTLLEKAVNRALELGESYELELEFVRPDGKKRWVYAHGEAKRNDSGRVFQLYGTAQDITEHKQAIEQRAELESQLRQAQKMEAVGQLAGGVAHDFNNLLCVINGRAQLILNRLPPGDPLCKPIELIYKTGERAANLTRQLLAFSRRQVLELKVLDLNAVINDLENMLRRLIREDIALTTVLDPALGRIKADPGQMEQVLVNLVVNARDAMSKGGTLTIETANAELSELNDASCRGHAGLKPGPYIMLAVSDTGCGMDDNVKAHLYEPFFTTKEPGKGTGLGLATVFGIVKQSLGNIYAESELGKGTTFKVYLPRTKQVRRAVSGPVPRLTTHGTETILVVEDDESVRDLTREILQSNGYTVRLACNGIEALSMCEKASHAIHLVISDVIMPKMSGTDLIARLRQIRPQIKVLFMSGYTDMMIDEKTFDLHTHFIQKPFTPASMSLKVRAVLDDAQ